MSDQPSQASQRLGALSNFEAERSYLHALKASAETDGDPERLAILNNLATLYVDTRDYSKGEQIPEELDHIALSKGKERDLEIAFCDIQCAIRAVARTRFGKTSQGRAAK